MAQWLLNQVLVYMDLGIDKGNKTVSNAKLNGKSNKGYAGASGLNFLIDVLLSPIGRVKTPAFRRQL